MSRSSRTGVTAAVATMTVCAGLALLAGSARATSNVGESLAPRLPALTVGGDASLGRAASAPWRIMRRGSLVRGSFPFSETLSPPAQTPFSVLQQTPTALIPTDLGESSRVLVDSDADVGRPPISPPVPPAGIFNAVAVAPLPPLPDLAKLGPLAVGDEGAAVVTLQTRLVALGFRPGSTEGKYGWTTYQAVLAFQKMEKIERLGEVNTETWVRLNAPQSYRPPMVGKHLRVDTDLERQVMFIANGNGPGTQVVLNTSSGGNYYYFNPESRVEEFASTPTGTYEVYRVVDGDDKGALGVLYRPQYFVGGYAIHGSPSVPEYPASHGCLRVSNPDMDWLWERMGYGSPVAVYDAITPAAYVERRNEELDAFRDSYVGDEGGLEAA